MGSEGKGRGPSRQPFGKQIPTIFFRRGRE
jgi:hypothetical protein